MIILTMAITKKKVRGKKKAADVIIVTKTKLPSSKTAFPEKLQKINELLSKSELLNS